MNAKNSEVRVGVIGHYSADGRPGHGTHLAFLGLPGVKIVSVSDPDEEGRNKLRTETGAVKSFADWQELMVKDRPDVVCVCSRFPGMHTEVVIAAARAGCHVYCEKPFAEDLENADKMIAASDESGSLISVAHLGRYSPMFQAAKALIQRGDIGRPVSVYCRGKEDDRLAGEDMLVLGSHLFDISRFLFGDPEWVFAFVASNGKGITLDDVHEPTEPVGPVAGDEIGALFGFLNGLRVYFESRQGLFDGENTRMGISIVGSEGSLYFCFDSSRRLLIRRGSCPPESGGDYEVIPTRYDDDILLHDSSIVVGDGSERQLYFRYCNRCAAMDILRAVEETREPLCSGRDARWALEMVLGVYSSHMLGCRFKLPAENRVHPLTPNLKPRLNGTRNPASARNHGD